MSLRPYVGSRLKLLLQRVLESGGHAIIFTYDSAYVASIFAILSTSAIQIQLGIIVFD